MNTKIVKTLEFEKIKQQLQVFTATDQGKEKIQQLHPETDVVKVTKLQDETSDGRKVLRLKGGIPMPRLKSIRNHLKRLEIGGTLNGKEISEIGRVLTTTKEIIHFFQWFEDNEIEFFVLDEIIAKLVVLPEITRKIQDTINEDGSILNDATPALKGIRTGIKQGEQNIRTKLDDIIRGKKATYLSDAIVTIRNDRYVIPVKLEYRNQFGGIVHDQSATGQTLYIEPQVILELNNHLRELAAQEKAEIDRILYELSMEIEPFSQELYRNSEVLATLDFINAKARYAEAIKATRPIISPENHVAIWQARHPLIDQADVVANDLILGEEYQAIVITGPNTGGKTIMLKTLGIVQMMGQSGLQIPANENSQIGVFTEIFADIGDEQSIEQSLSTFSSHMTNIVSILNQIDDKSLVLLDELGSGTDPQEGASLAISILDYIGGIGSYVMATTHYPELKAYGYNRSGTINASMEFNVETLAPTYRLQIGVPGRSNAFDISKRLGLKPSIIDQARSFIDVDSQNLNEMIADLEQKRRVTEMESSQLKKQLEESDELLNNLKKAKEKLETSKEKMVEDAKKDANKLVAAAKEEAEFLLQEIRELQMNLGANNAVKEHELINLRKQFDNLHQEESLKKNKILRKEKEKKIFKPGDEVITETYGQRGTLVEKSGNTEWVVQMGMMKMKLPESDLRIIKEEPQQQQRKRQMATIKSVSSSHVSTQLDLRGQRYEEALAEMDQYLDAALLAGYPQVTIVHGKGTGAIRKGVTEALKRHPQVKSYEFAPMNAGGNGATIVTFKG